MRLVCYYANWSVYRHTNIPILYLDTIDPALCTHIHVAFALINPTTLEIEPSEKHDIHYTDVFSAVCIPVSRFHHLRLFSSHCIHACINWNDANHRWNYSWRSEDGQQPAKHLTMSFTTRRVERNSFNKRKNFSTSGISMGLTWWVFSWWQMTERTTFER